MYINGANENQNIEITNQRRLLAPYKRNLKNIIVDGFIFERCGNQYPNKFWSRRANQQAGAVGTRCGKFWTIQNNIIRFANGIGIDWGNEGGSKQDLELGKKYVHLECQLQFPRGGPWHLLANRQISRR